MGGKAGNDGGIRPLGGAARGIASVIPGIALMAAMSFGQGPDSLPPTSELKKMSLEELMEIEVTLVSKQPEKLAEAASAIQVITGDDLRRSGVQTLPEALRLASNLQVAQVNSKDWAITARGFNGTATSNKLLVMIDGRTVYTPLYAGVFWDVQHVILEDIDRIEVVSGPGGTLWGANAVNGVINVITKDAKETGGVLAGNGGGTFMRNSGAVRFGGKSASGIHYRVFGQRLDHDETVLQDGADGRNAWEYKKGGFRMDWQAGHADRLTVQGELYGGDFDQRNPLPTVKANGQNLQARWERKLSERSDMHAKAYFDRTWREIPGSFEQDLRTWDMDFFHNFRPGSFNNFTWGGGYRLMQDDVGSSKSLAFLPARKDLQLFNGFIQDQASLLAHRLRLTVGTKVEHNDYSGWELMPSFRAALSPTESHTIWGSVSRAVRSPSRIDVDFYAPAPNPPLTDTLQRLTGGTDFTSEKVTAYELGYRLRPVEKLSLSLSGFFNRYEDLRILERLSTDSLQFRIANGLEGDGWGIEFSGNCQALPWWRLRGGLTYLHPAELEEIPGHTAFASTGIQGNDPEYQFSLQSYMDLPKGFELNGSARYVDALPSPDVPSYMAVDLGVAWRRDKVEASLHGYNLGVDSHPEFGALSTNPRSAPRHEIPRSITGRVAWHL